jgi:pilus assembly protein CpaB
MKRAQVLGIAVAGFCGLGAFVLMRSIVEKPREIVTEVQSNTVKVLVARSELSLGTITTEQSFRWQDYPETAVPAVAITCRNSACSTKDNVGRIARVQVQKDELITHSKLVKLGEGGVLAAILPEGKRAVSTKITEDSAVGKLILPNDYVDVIVSRRVRGRNGQEEFDTETLMRNIHVLAIGQRIETKDGQKQAEGNTATLELSANQAEQLSTAKMRGEITLSLRSLADINRGDEDGGSKKRNMKEANEIQIWRYGVRSRAQRVN